VPAEAEIVIEGEVSLSDTRDEGPYGDHTGYYNASSVPVFTVTRSPCGRIRSICRRSPGRPPDEPLDTGEALNEVSYRCCSKQFPGDRRFLAAPEGCSYRIASSAIRKAYPGHCKRVMMAVWSYLRSS
jgi:4-hydroxy-3-polyprenylbenzoate decarboxylase